MLSSADCLTLNGAACVDNPVANPVASPGGLGAQLSVEKAPPSEFQSILAQMPSHALNGQPFELTDLIGLDSQSLPVEDGFLPPAFPLLAGEQPLSDQELSDQQLSDQQLSDQQSVMAAMLTLIEPSASHEGISSMLFSSGLFSSEHEQTEKGEAEDRKLILGLDEEVVMATHESLVCAPSLTPWLVVADSTDDDAALIIAKDRAEADKDALRFERSTALNICLNEDQAEGKLSQNSADRASMKDLMSSLSPAVDGAVLQAAVADADQPGAEQVKQAEALMATAPLAEARSNKPVMPSAVVMHLSASVYKPEWADQFHGRIRWMVEQQISSAKVIIDPPELGPMQVDVARTADNGTQITFTVNNLAVKELLEANMARFKNLLASGESQNVQVDVRQQHQQHQQSQQKEAEPLEQERRYALKDRLSTPVESYFMGRPQGLLDHYV